MDLIKQLTALSVLITPNRRLAAGFLKKHQALQGINQHYWETPSILPYNSWLEQLWKNSLAHTERDHSLLLRPEQELAMWEQIVRDSPESDALLQPARTAELAKSAWGIIQQWQIDINHASFQGTEDTRVFQQWALAFTKRCHEKEWIDSYSLAAAITQKIQNGAIKIPKKIFVAGFTEYSPQQKALFYACEQQGSEIIHYNRKQTPDSMSRISLADTETEMYTMARWAKNLLVTQKQSMLIGCVIPNLEDRRDQVIRIFSEVFDHKNQYSLNYIGLPFNISAGKSLASYPIIHTALQLLKLHAKNIARDVFTHILRSPFLGEADSEQIARAKYETHLIKENITSLCVKNLLTHQKLQLSAFCPALAKRIKVYFKSIDLNEKRRPSEWISQFLELLNILGWPGERRLNSMEYQTVQNCWLPLLNTFRTFDTVFDSVNYHSALHYLTRITASTVFQAQSPEAPIQILGMLEAAEIPFDHLWVMGLDDTAWPPAAKPNPFIPSYLQKLLNTPNANAERELLYCKKLMTQLKNSSKSIVFSHSLQNEKAELRPSALITDILNQPIAEFANFIPLAEKLYETRKLTYFQDNIAPVIQNKNALKGGVNIFKQQAACPFKAYAEIRLHAIKPDIAVLGLRPQDRGSIVHKALELIWQVLEDSETLKNYPEDKLAALIDSTVTQSLSRVDKTQNRYLSLEKNRLKKLLSNWLALEKTRPFFKVLFREEEHHSTIGDIGIKLRVDRIDELHNGEKLIIDYKTGKNNQLKHLFDTRLQEPQLPIYCISSAENIVGVSFSEVHPDALKNLGISKSDLNIPGIKPLTETKYSTATSWDEQLTAWQEILEKIATDFCEGNASVDPKDLVDTCKHCNLKSLCRIYETSVHP